MSVPNQPPLKTAGDIRFALVAAQIENVKRQLTDINKIIASLEETYTGGNK